VLWRTVTLVLASLVFNYPLRAEGDEVIVNPASDVLTVANDHVRVDSREGRWFVEWLDVPATLAGLTTTVTVGGATETTDAAGWTNSARSVKLSDRLGDSDGIEMVCRREDGLEVTAIARTLADQPAAVFTVRVRNGSAKSVTVENIRLLSTDGGLSPGACADPGQDLSVYVDSGSQGGTRAAPLGDGQNCAGICAIHNRVADLGFVCAFLSFEHDNVVTVSPGDDGVSLSARTTTPVELSPGAAHDCDPVLVSCYANPFEALERYADAVRDLNLPPIPERTPMGWISWYCYRLTMTEDTVLENADVIARHFRKYGVNLIQLDHGWQDRDICGNWVENEKFPHGLPWLSERLRAMGFEMGLWAAPSVVSEFAPLVAEHPEALVLNNDGTPLVVSKRWTWAPHGMTHRVDPMKPAGQQFLREFAALMNGYGITYLKTDFISNWGGAVPARTGMTILREELDDTIMLRPCSTALNILLGFAGEIGIARDIGNAGGNWKHMRVYTLEAASKWFMHRRFWLNSGGCLIVGDPNETLGEAIGRATILALTGGTALLSDRMPELEAQPERLAMVPLCLPPSDVPARPIDLFEVGRNGREYPRVWHLHADAGWGQWQVVGLINWSEHPIEETVRFADLGLPPDAECLVFDFWTGTLAGRFTGSCTATVPAGAARCLRIMRVTDRPAVVGTDMHVTQGLVELSDVRWDEEKLTLSGQAERAPGAAGNVLVWVPDGYAVTAGQEVHERGPRCTAVPVQFDEAQHGWSAHFERANGGQTLPLEPGDSVLREAAVRWFGGSR
jgi:hypothetical protein